MSASERLREFHPFGWYEAEMQDGRKLRLMPAEIVDALPEIVALVEAAESVESVFDDDRLSHFLVMTERGVRLRAALAALEEKLKP